MSGDIAEHASSPALAEPTEAAPAYVARAASWLPGLGAAVLVYAVGIADGGYFPTAWAPLTLAFLAVAACALVVSPARLGWRVLALPAVLAGIAVWALASAWWGSPTEAVPEAQRALAYAAGALAFAVVLRREHVERFLVGLWVGISAVCLDALAGRLLPERFAEYDPIGRYRLAEPVGYWNALGVLAALGLLLAVSLAGRAESLVVRLAAAASTVPLALTLYFTFSRGAWLALLAGLVVVLVVDPRRLQFLVTALVVAPWPALAVLLASQSEPLTEVGHTLMSASRDGHAVAAVAAGLALAAAAAAAFAASIEPRVRLGRRVSLVANVGLIASVAAALALFVFALGGPSKIARSFAAAPPPTADLNERLFDLQGSRRVDGWRVALDGFREHPVVGSGGGSYERRWLAERPIDGAIRDAHSLYVEALAEYGVVGLALLVVLFGLPLVLAVRFRHAPLVPATAGVLSVYVVHAGIDWDWEFPVLSLVALGCAAAIMASGDSGPARSRRSPGRLALLAALLALVPVAVFGGLGARAEAASADAFAARDYARALDEARRAESLSPWSVGPLLLLGRAQAGAGNLVAARRTFRRAVREEPGSWRLWYELAAVSRGAERAAAVRRAQALNPRERLLDSLDQGG